MRGHRWAPAEHPGSGSGEALGEDSVVTRPAFWKGGGLVKHNDGVDSVRINQKD